MSIPRAQPHAQSLFLFPIVFGINLIHFFDEKKDGSIVCFGDSIPCHAIWQKQNFAANYAYCFEECNIFGNGKCELSAIHEGRKRCKFWQGKGQNSLPILRCTFLARKSAKPIANFQNATWVASLPSHSLSLSSLYLSLSLSHRAHLTHNIGSASALPIILWNYKLVHPGAMKLVLWRHWCM